MSSATTLVALQLYFTNLLGKMITNIQELKEFYTKKELN
jgi:hypothetical protein